MAITIAVSGKGGSGKSTIAAMMVRILVESSAGTVLAVDADPNSCLGLIMGVEVEDTVANIREEVRTKDNDGTDRVRSFEYGIQQVISEAKGFDLLTMGRPEGPSCYCAANNLLRKFMEKLGDAYNFVVIDNEAGMEHLSRRTTNNVDLLCIVSEATPVGEITAKRICDLTKTLSINIKQAGLIWNRTDNTKNVDGLENLGCVPYDEAVYQASMQSKTIFDIKTNSPAFLSVQGILEKQLKLKVNI